MPSDSTARRVVARFLGRKAPTTPQRVVGRYLLAREFPSPEALKDYLHEHPHADKSRHTVKKQEEKPKKEEESKEEVSKNEPASTPKLFSDKDTEGLGTEVRQKLHDPKKLFAAAKKAHENQLDLLNRGKGLDKDIDAKVIRIDQGDKVDYSKPGPIILIGPMKSMDRSKEKVEADFGGDWSRLGDIVRSSIAVDSMDQLEDVVAKLKKAGIKLARRPKDRFAKPTDAGYRDMLLSVEYPGGFVGEMQLHLKPILKAKDEGHKFYEEVRSIEAKAKQEGRTTLTDEETKAIEKANGQMKELYEKAWQEARRKKEASMRTFMAATTRYYDWHDVPAIWEPKKFPHKITHKGQIIIYELEKFFTEASPITKAEFDEMVDRQQKK